MPVPQSYVSPEERAEREERARRDAEMSQPEPPLGASNVLLECPDRPAGLPRAGDRGEDWGGVKPGDRL